MKQTRKGKVFRFPFFKNIAFSYNKCYECAPVATVVFVANAILVEVFTGFSPLLLSNLYILLNT